MRFGSLFAGIGGFDLGLERAGMEPAWQVEINSYCLQVLDRHWPDVKRYGDIKEIDATDLEAVDLICGGFPCQPASYAGQQRGTTDRRWLWPEFFRILRGARPRWVLVENVPGLLSVNSGRAFGEVVGDLASLGYDIEWDCIPAAAVGAPHKRDRVWIVACAKPSLDPDADSRRREELGEHDGGTQEPDEQASLRDDAGGLRSAFPGCIFSDPPGRDPEGFWQAEPRVDRVVDGLPSRVDRVGALGNAVVPAVVEFIGRRIMLFEKKNL